MTASNVEELKYILTITFLPSKIHVLTIEDYFVTSHEVFCINIINVASLYAWFSKKNWCHSIL